MNKDRRTKIAQIINEINNSKDKLQGILDDEQFSFDNMPENLQGSVRGQESEESIEVLEEAIEQLSEAVTQLENI